MKEAAGINQSSDAISRQQSAETCSESPRKARYTVLLQVAILSTDLVISQGRMGSYGLTLLLDKITHPEGQNATVPREKGISCSPYAPEACSSKSLLYPGQSRGRGMLFY